MSSPTKRLVDVNLRDPKTKEEALPFIFAVMTAPFALFSPDFQIAVDLSERFNISVKDVLEFRKRRGKPPT